MARFLVVKQRPGVRLGPGQWRVANVGVPDRSAGMLACAMGPMCSPPGGGWCASAVVKRRDWRSTEWIAPFPIGVTVQRRRAPKGLPGWNGKRLFITASTSNAGGAAYLPCPFLPAWIRPGLSVPQPMARGPWAMLPGATWHEMPRPDPHPGL